jgi:hypothetical protein
VKAGPAAFGASRSAIGSSHFKYEGDNELATGRCSHSLGSNRQMRGEFVQRLRARSNKFSKVGTRINAEQVARELSQSNGNANPPGLGNSGMTHAWSLSQQPDHAACCHREGQNCSGHNND